MANVSKTQKQLETVAEFLRDESTMALATVGARGEAAATPLFYLLGEELTLYFLSSAASGHGGNLAARPEVAVTVYRQTESWKEICGVQMRGVAMAISDPERRREVLKLYRERFHLGAALRVAMGRCTLYEFWPDFFRFIDNSKHFGYNFEVTRERS